MLLARTALQDAEENVVLEEAAVIEAARRQEMALKKAAAQPPRSGTLGISQTQHSLSSFAVCCGACGLLVAQP